MSDKESSAMPVSQDAYAIFQGLEPPTRVSNDNPLAVNSGTSDIIKQPWEHTSKEFADAQLNASEYKSEYENDTRMKDYFLNNQKNKWKESVEERAAQGRLPDHVIDDYADQYGEQAVIKKIASCR